MPVTAIQMPAGNAYPDCLYNVEAEAALLGALMISNDWIDRIADQVRPEDFMEPLHGRIYAAILNTAATEQRANPVLLRPMFVDDPAMIQLGGPAYLAQLTGSGAALIGVRQFAAQIADMAKRRRVYDALQETIVSMQKADNLDVAVEALAETVDSALTAAMAKHGVTQGRSIAAAMDATLGRIDDEASGIAVPGVKLDGFADWNYLTGNMRYGEVIILGGRPGMGKTATALSAWLATGRAGKGGLYISLEMSEDELMRRAIADLVFEYGQNPTYDQIRSARLSPHDRQRIQSAREMIESWPLQLTDPATLKIGRLASLIRRYQRSFAAKGQTLDVVFIDYLGLIKPDRETGSRYNDVGAISRAIKEVAKACGVCIVVLAQLSRKCEEREDKRPLLSDLRDAGDIEQDADIVMFVYRDEYYLQAAEPKVDDKRRADWELALQAARDHVELYTAKRRGGALGRRNCFFFGAHQAVRDHTFFQDTRL
ncbi:replicative DNA helicase [Sphingomonas sp.]|uniref:replicative DNA helicase n=1 Tax=Sphingomonas sp. TaxID=28214 RepID=UPI003BAADFEA